MVMKTTPRLLFEMFVLTLMTLFPIIMSSERNISAIALIQRPSIDFLKGERKLRLSPRKHVNSHLTSALSVYAPGIKV